MLLHRFAWKGQLKKTKTPHVNVGKKKTFSMDWIKGKFTGKPHI
jgi:hypothetical protein